MALKVLVDSGGKLVLPRNPLQELSPSWEPLPVWEKTESGDYVNTGEQKRAGGVPMWEMRGQCYDHRGVEQAISFVCVSAKKPNLLVDDLRLFEGGEMSDEADTV